MPSVRPLVPLAVGSPHSQHTRLHQPDRPPHLAHSAAGDGQLGDGRVAGRRRAAKRLADGGRPLPHRHDQRRPLQHLDLLLREEVGRAEVGRVGRRERGVVGVPRAALVRLTPGEHAQRGGHRVGALHAQVDGARRRDGHNLLASRDRARGHHAAEAAKVGNRHVRQAASVNAVPGGLGGASDTFALPPARPPLPDLLAVRLVASIASGARPTSKGDRTVAGAHCGCHAAAAPAPSSTASKAAIFSRCE
eukprot:scaffold8624_cov110-Isochrysis_galbana.AAC.2